MDNTIYDGSNSKSTYTTYAYDAFGNRTQQVFSGDASVSGDELETDTTYSYNTSAFIVNRPGLVEQRVPGGSALTSHEMLYDGAGAWTPAPTVGDVTKVRNLLLPGGTYVAKTFGYDAYGNQTSATDETSRATTTTFDGTDHLFPVSVSNPSNETVTTDWDKSCGAPTQGTDPNSQSTTMQYDALCRLTRTDGPLGAFETRAYLNLGDANAQHMRVETNPPTGASGNLFSEAYTDGLGRAYLTKNRGPSPAQTIVTETTYNARGGVATTTAPYYEGDLQEVTEYEYDSQDRSKGVRHPDNTTVATSFGLWEVTTTDENGKSSTRLADAYGHTVKTEHTLNGQPVTSVSAFDDLGRIVELTDALGNAWSWTYDSLGRVVARNNPDSGNWVYAYDGAGRPIQQTDAKGQVTTFTYDSVGRPATKTSGVGTTTMTYGEARAGFYNAGRLTSIASPTSILETDYDAAARAVKTKRTFGGVDYVLERRFDASGRATGVTYPDGDSVGPVGNPYLYDEAGRLRAIPGILTSVQYDASGRATVRTNSNGTQTTWEYSSERGFLDGLQTAGPTTVQALTYSRDPAGLIEQVTSAFPERELELHL